MAERLTIVAMGKQTIAERLRDRVWGALYNLPLTASDDERAAHVVSAIFCEGKHEQFPDHGTWANSSTHS